ncbi:hypothetical protein GCM10027074_56280 [Streptomyces deserti]
MAAAGMCAAQYPAFGLAWWIGSFRGDDYGAGGGGALGLLCMAVFAPVVLPVAGLLHATAQMAPAAVLAHLTSGRVRGPEWARLPLCAALVGACWAGSAAVLWGRPLITTAPLSAGLGLLPALAVVCVRRRAQVTGRPWSGLGIWFRSALVSFGLCFVVLVGGVVGTASGLIDEYEPPVLSAGQLTGAWRGPDGAVLRLDPGGRAEVTGLPTENEFNAPSAKDFTVCDGTGIWFLDREGRHDQYLDDGPAQRDGVVVRLGDRCGQDTYWTIGGTAREPELFVLFGDPDAGELRILTRA